MVKLTQDEATDLQKQLIRGYKQAEFQVKLRDEWRQAGNDPRAQRRAVQEVCLDVQLPVIVQFGFGESRTGVNQSILAVAEVPQTEELEEDRRVIAWLLDPSLQREEPDFVPDALVPKHAHTNLRAEDVRKKGSRWVVVGGEQGRGILVRKGEDLDSAAYAFRLQCGAQLHAMQEVVGNRLHYRRLSGDGPDFGWISIEVKGKALVQPDLDGLASDKHHGIMPHLFRPAWTGFDRKTRALPDVAFSLTSVTADMESQWRIMYR
mmetsp:Transcript_17913/g.37225  ORF Transcript_17913/g.37225 Transcript_17913/m.37225 type:complete len:263 (+) Transcript_17913:47-835(+)